MLRALIEKNRAERLFMARCRLRTSSFFYYKRRGYADEQAMTLACQDADNLATPMPIFAWMKSKSWRFRHWRTSRRMQRFIDIFSEQLRRRLDMGMDQNTAFEQALNTMESLKRRGWRG